MLFFKVAKLPGWNFHLIDGGASASNRAEALNQAIALQPDVSCLARLMPTSKRRCRRRRHHRDWLARPGLAGPERIVADFTNITADPVEGGAWRAYYAVADTDSGPNNLYDLENGYREPYKKIWGVKQPRKRRGSARCARLKLPITWRTPMLHHQPSDFEIRPDPDWPDWLKSEFETNQDNARVGTQLLSESKRVRVWHLAIKPGERLPVHRHVLDYFWTALTPGKARSHYHDGRTVEAEYRPGETQHYRFEPGKFMMHDLENIGDTVLAFTTVEFLDSSNPPLTVG